MITRCFILPLRDQSVAVLSILCESKANVLALYAEKLPHAVRKLARDGAMMEWKADRGHFRNGSGRERR